MDSVEGKRSSNEWMRQVLLIQYCSALTLIKIEHAPLAFLAPTLNIRNVLFKCEYKNAFHVHFYSYTFFKLHSKDENNLHIHPRLC